MLIKTNNIMLTRASSIRMLVLAKTATDAISVADDSRSWLNRDNQKIPTISATPLSHIRKSEAQQAREFLQNGGKLPVHASLLVWDDPLHTEKKILHEKGEIFLVDFVLEEYAEIPEPPAEKEQQPIEGEEKMIDRIEAL